MGMHRFAIIGAGLLVIARFVTPAAAADLPASVYTKAPVTPVVIYNWTGCHVGANLGGAVSDDRTTSLLGISRDFSEAGVVAGGQIGCDYQFASGWIVGVEGRAAWSSLEKTHTGTIRFVATGLTVPSQSTFRNDFLASTTARLGYSFADRWLVFGRGGAAWTREKVDEAFNDLFLGGIAVDPRASTTRSGWTVGTGVEWAFAPHWSAVLDYSYYDFGSAGVRLHDPASGTSVIINSLKDTIHAVTAGVNYHF